MLTSVIAGHILLTCAKQGFVLTIYYVNYFDINLVLVYYRLVKNHYATFPQLSMVRINLHKKHA